MGHTRSVSGHCDYLLGFFGVLSGFVELCSSKVSLLAPQGMKIIAGKLTVFGERQLFARTACYQHLST